MLGVGEINLLYYFGCDENSLCDHPLPSNSSDMPHPLYLIFFSELIIGLIILVVKIIQYKNRVRN